MAIHDLALIESWRKDNNPEAFQVLVERHGGMVYGAALRVLRDAGQAEDVAQECFFEMARAGRRLPHTSVAGWLHRVATRRAVDRLRSDIRRRNREEAAARDKAVSHDAGWAEIRELVDEAIAALPDDLRAPLVAHYLEGQTHAELADTWGLDRSTVTKRIQRGVERLRTHLKRRGVVIGSAGLATALASAPAQALPAAAAAELGKLALAGAGTTIAAGGLFAGWSTAKIIAVSAVVVVTAGGLAATQPEVREGSMQAVSVISTLKDPDEMLGLIRRTQGEAANRSKSHPSPRATRKKTRNEERGPEIASGMTDERDDLAAAATQLGQRREEPATGLFATPEAPARTQESGPQRVLDGVHPARNESPKSIDVDTPDAPIPTPYEALEAAAEQYEISPERQAQLREAIDRIMAQPAAQEAYAVASPARRKQLNSHIEGAVVGLMREVNDTALQGEYRGALLEQGLARTLSSPAFGTEMTPELETQFAAMADVLTDAALAHYPDLAWTAVETALYESYLEEFRRRHEMDTMPELKHPLPEAEFEAGLAALAEAAQASDMAGGRPLWPGGAWVPHWDEMDEEERRAALEEEAESIARKLRTGLAGAEEGMMRQFTQYSLREHFQDIEVPNLDPDPELAAYNAELAQAARQERKERRDAEQERWHEENARRFREREARVNAVNPQSPSENDADPSSPTAGLQEPDDPLPSAEEAAPAEASPATGPPAEAAPEVTKNPTTRTSAEPRFHPFLIPAASAAAVLALAVAAGVFWLRRALRR